MKLAGWVSAIVLIGAIVVGAFLVFDAGGLPTAWKPAAPAPSVSEHVQPIPAAATPATIEYVHDGDTVFLTDGTKVRLLGIDTPEVGDHLECYGEEATALLRSLLPEGTEVSVQADVEPLDQYGRSLLFVYTQNGVLVNLEMIERGAAESVVLAPNLLFADELEAAEDAAQTAGLGMWGAC